MPTAIHNVNVFRDGEVSAPQTIVIENGLTTDQTTWDTELDGSGCTLLPAVSIVTSHE